MHLIQISMNVMFEKLILFIHSTQNVFIIQRSCKFKIVIFALAKCFRPHPNLSVTVFIKILLLISLYCFSYINSTEKKFYGNYEIKIKFHLISLLSTVHLDFKIGLTSFSAFNCGYVLLHEDSKRIPNLGLYLNFSQVLNFIR